MDLFSPNFLSPDNHTGGGALRALRAEDARGLRHMGDLFPNNRLYLRGSFPISLIPSRPHLFSLGSRFPLKFSLGDLSLSVPPGSSFFASHRNTTFSTRSLSPGGDLSPFLCVSECLAVSLCLSGSLSRFSLFIPVSESLSSPLVIPLNPSLSQTRKPPPALSPRASS